MTELLVVAPHMDDEVLGCGGLLQHVAPGEAHVVFVSERAADQRFLGGEYVAYDGRRRVTEMEAVAALLGFTFDRLALPLHALDRLPTSELLDRMEAIVRQRAPRCIAIPGPSADTDHQAVARACRGLARPHFFAGSLLEYWVSGLPGPDAPVLAVPLSASELRRKVEAVGLYRTQLRTGGREPDPLYAYGPESVETWARAAGRLVHAEAAEVFTPLRVVLPTDGNLLRSR